MRKLRRCGRPIQILLVVLLVLTQMQPLIALSAPAEVPSPISAFAPGGPAGTETPTAARPQTGPIGAKAAPTTPLAPAPQIAPAISTVQSSTVLASFYPPRPNGDAAGRAVSFDGTNLWLTFRDTGASQDPNPYIYKVSTSGQLLQTYNVGHNIGALAWDPTRNVFWAAGYQDSPGNVYTFDPATGVLAQQFTFYPQGGTCFDEQFASYFDGLAYDSSTDSLWISGDEGSVVYNLTTTGAVRSFFPMSTIGYRCNTGIAFQPDATGSPSIWLADGEDNLITHADTSGNLLEGTFSGTFGTSGMEAIAYDAVTFPGKCAVWKNDAYDQPYVEAYEVPCLAQPAAPTKPAVQSVPSGTSKSPPKLTTATSRDPVDTFTGAFTYSRTDLAIPGLGPNITFTRTYNSNDDRQSPFSQGWTHNYNIRLRLSSASSTDVYLVGPMGRSDRYTNNPDGSYSPPPLVSTTLVHNADNTWTATLKDQTTWTFDRVGNLIAIADRFGNTSNLAYDAYGKLVSVSDPAGRGSLTIGYDYDGRITSVSDWSSPPRVVQYSYSWGPGPEYTPRLVSATDRTGEYGAIYNYEPEPNSWGFVRPLTMYLTHVEDDNSQIQIRNTYESGGHRVIAQQDALGITTGQQTTFSYAFNSEQIWTATVTYPANSFDGVRPTVVDTYDAQGRLIQRVSTPTGERNAAITQTFAYDASSNLSATTDGRGQTTNFCYDVGYDGQPIPGSLGNLTRQIDPQPASKASRPVTLYEYDSKNNLIQVIPPRGVASGSTVTCSTNLGGAINLNYATDNAYDSATQTKLESVTERSTDPELGLRTAVTKYEYGDPVNPGMVTRTIPPRGNTGPTPDYSYATTMTYFGRGIPQAGMLQSKTDPLGNTTTYDYDAVGRKVKMVDPNGNVQGANPLDHTWEYQYDNEDRLRLTKAPAPQAGGSQLVTDYRYDNTGDRTVVIDPNGQVTKYVYDERHKLKEVWESPNPWTDPNATPSPKYITAYQYDDLGNLKRVVRAQGDASYERATDYAYDGLNRLRKETQYPSWPSTSGTLLRQYTYDADGNLLTYKDPLNQTTTFTYDYLNRATLAHYSNRQTADISYAYDIGGNRTSMADGTGTTSYTYDERNRSLQVTSPGPKTMKYRYDLDGNRTKVIYPDNTQVTYTFDKASRLESLLDWANRTTGYQYYPDGTLKVISNVNGTTSQLTYDNAARLTQALNQQGTNTISKHAYMPDAMGNRTQADELLPQLGVPGQTTPSLTTYGYDRLNRLTTVNAPSGQTTYGYDPVGNRLTLTRGSQTSYAYDRADRIASAGGVTYTVNANGNLSARGSDSFVFDQANRLTSATIGGSTSTYVYDGDGKRTRKTAGGQTTNFVYDASVSLPVVLDDGARKYVYGVGLAYAVDTSGNPLVYHADGLGSVRAITNASGNVVQTYQTDEFGVATQSQGSVNQPFQYTGEQRDAESNLVYLRARMYDPVVGRFVSRDRNPGSTTESPTLNYYTYASDNPVRFTDPSGLLTIGGCVTVSFGVGYLVTASGCVTVASNGDVGLVGSAGGGGIAGWTAGASAGVQVSNGDKVSDLNGPFTFGGGSTSALGGRIGVDGFVGKNDTGRTIAGTTFQVGLGQDNTPPGWPGAEVHGGETTSVSGSFNLPDALKAIAPPVPKTAPNRPATGK